LSPFDEEHFVVGRKAVLICLLGPELDINVTLMTKLYDKYDDFNFTIVTYAFLDSNILPSSAYGVYMAQSI